MKITVVTVTYNAAGTIKDTLASVLAQDYGNYEHIIVDGLSTDRTMEVVRSCEHGRLMWSSEADAGIYDAMNRGLRLASGDLVGFLNADDYFCRTDALSLIAAAAAAAPEVSAIACDVAIIDPSRHGRIIRHYPALGYSRWMARFGHMVPHPGLYARKGAVQLVGEFDPTYKISGDFEWCIRLLHTYSVPLITPGVTTVAMRNGGASTRNFRSRLSGNTEITRALRSNALPSYPGLVWAKYLLKSSQLVLRSLDYPPPPAVAWRPAKIDCDRNAI